MRPANERPRYNVTSPLIGWSHAQDDPGVKMSCWGEFTSSQYVNETFREQHPRPANIRETHKMFVELETWPSKAISRYIYCFMLYVLRITPPNLSPIPEICPTFHPTPPAHTSPEISIFCSDKFQSSVESAKISRAWPFYIAIPFIVLCIIPPNLRPIPKILKGLERQRLCLVQTDRRTDGLAHETTTIPVGAYGGQG